MNGLNEIVSANEKASQLKTYHIEFEVGVDKWGDEDSHELSADGKSIFSAGNGEPEDNILSRDVFTGKDYIDAVEFGMSLRAKGYTKLGITYTGAEVN